MDPKKKKKVIIVSIISFVALAGVVTGAIYIFKPKEETGSGSGSGSGSEGLPKEGNESADTPNNGLGAFINSALGLAGAAAEGSADQGTKWKVLEFDEKLSGATNLVITFKNPRPAQGEIKSYNKIKIEGMGKYDGEHRIWYDKGIWIDAAGKVGAIYVKAPNVTSESKSNKPINAYVTKL